MTTYLIWTGVICICLLISMQSLRLRYIPGMDMNRYIPSRLPVFLIFIILAGLYTFRWCNGTDFFNYYMDFYSSRNESISYITEQRDFLFALITYITRNFISENFLVYNAILAVCTYAPILIVMRKYSFNFSITVLLYILSTACFRPYNTVRQGIAVAIMFGAFPFLMEKRNKKFIFCSLIAFCFHPTSAIAACVMMFCHSDFLSRKIWYFLVLFLGSGVALRSIWNRLMNLLNVIGQTKMATDYADALSGSTGVNILHVLVAVVPLVLMILYRNNLLNTEDNAEYEFNSFYMNCLLFYVGFVLIGMYNPIFARMGQFFELYLLMLYPKLIEKVSGSSKKVMTIFVLTAYFAYFLIVLPRGGNYVPYQFNHYSLEGIIMWQ